MMNLYDMDTINNNKCRVFKICIGWILTPKIHFDIDYTIMICKQYSVLQKDIWISSTRHAKIHESTDR